jgi:hypothetical protein
MYARGVNRCQPVGVTIFIFRQRVAIVRAPVLVSGMAKSKHGSNGNWAKAAKLAARGIPQVEIARRLGVSRQAVAKGIKAMAAKVSK